MEDDPSTLEPTPPTHAGEDADGQHVAEPKFIERFHDAAPKASWIFGSVLLTVLIITLFFPGKLNENARPILHFFMALTAALLAVFLVGGVLLKGNLKGLAVTATGGFALLIAVLFLWEPFPNAPKDKSYSRDLENLGSDNIQVRMAALAALGQTAHDSKSTHWEIIEQVTSFLHNNSSREMDGGARQGDQLSEDIKKAVEVIRDRAAAYEEKGQHLDLKSLHLPGADFVKAKLVAANFHGSNLSNASFWKADLTSAILSDCVLISARFSEAVLEGTNFQGSKLNGASLRDANSKGTVFAGVNLTGASFQRANLANAVFRHADLTNANLSGADLSNADLREAIVTPEQIRSARNYRTAQLSDQLRSALAAPTP